MFNYDEVQKLFAERLREVRKKEAISQLQLASKLDMGQATISNLEASSADPSLKTIIKLSNELNVSMAWLLGFSEKPHEPTSDAGMFALLIEIMDNNNSPWKIVTNLGNCCYDEEGEHFFDKKGEVAICTNDMRFERFVRRYWGAIEAGENIVENFGLPEDYADELKKKAVSEFKDKFEKESSNTTPSLMR